MLIESVYLELLVTSEFYALLSMWLPPL